MRAVAILARNGPSCADTRLKVTGGESPARFCPLPLTAIADDLRVRRQVESFDRADWCVVGIGPPGERF